DVAPRFWEAETDLRSEATKKPNGKHRIRVVLLQHERNAMRRYVSECETSRVATGSDDTGRRLASYLGPNHSPRRRRAANSLPVFPRPGTVKRMEIEQLEGKSNLRQHVALAAS